MFYITVLTCYAGRAMMLGMELIEAEQAVKSLLAERESAKRELEAARKRLNGFEMAITGFLQVFPELQHQLVSPEPGKAPRILNSDQPRGQAAISEILEAPEYRGKFWTVAQMTEELQRRGWEPDSDKPANSVRVALSRLTESNPRIHKGPGEHGHIVYFYQGEDLLPPRFHKGEVAAKSSRS